MQKASPQVCGLAFFPGKAIIHSFTFSCRVPILFLVCAQGLEPPFMATSQVETIGDGADKVKVGVALLLVLAGFVAYFVLSSQAGYIRWGVLTAGVIAGVVLFLFSGVGKGLWLFAHDSERELRKVVWPTKKETLQTALFVFVFVVLLSIFLWLVDKGLEWMLYSLILGWR